MRVLHVLNTGKYSGAENVVITLIHALGDRAKCAYVSPDGPIRDILMENGIEFYPVSTPATNAKELKTIIKGFQPDIIHTHDYNAGVMATFTGTKVPIINHVHNNTTWLKTICPKSLAYFISCTRYVKILTVSESVMDDFIFGAVVSKKAKVVGNPIDLTAIRKKVNDSDAIKESSDIIFLGRMSEAKNPLFFLSIVSKLVHIYPNLRVAMVGSGELKTEVEHQIAKLGLNNTITMYGFQRNPYGLLQESKVMCMPSVWEGFGIAAVEGLALGKPVVASPVGGIPNIVNQDCGFLCNDVEEYVSAIVSLLHNNDLYKSFSNAAYARANQLDNCRDYTERMYEIYRDVIEKQ